jgi:hypothetical protein
MMNIDDDKDKHTFSTIDDDDNEGSELSILLKPPSCMLDERVV